MALDIDKNFPRRRGKQRRQRTKTERATALEKMKKCLIDGQSCKFAALEGGYSMGSGMRFFKSKTGMTMMEYRNLTAAKPQ